MVKNHKKVVAGTKVYKNYRDPLLQVGNKKEKQTAFPEKIFLQLSYPNPVVRTPLEKTFMQ